MSLVAWGLVCWLRRQPVVIGPLALGCLVIVVFTVGYGADSDNSVYLIPAGVVAAVLAGLGMARLEAKASRRRAGPLAAVALTAAVCALLLSANWSRADQHNTWRYRDQMAAELLQMDKHAIFVADMDLPIFCSYYLQQVEGLRRDITLLPPHQLWQPWYAPTLPDRELSETSLRLWTQLTKDYHLTAADGNDFWQAVSLFAVRLAEHYRGRRTVYAVHAPMTPLPGPPYFTGVNRDLVRLDFEEPQVLRPAKPAPPAASFAAGVNLMSLELGAKQARPGELVSLSRPLALGVLSRRIAVRDPTSPGAPRALGDRDGKRRVHAGVRAHLRSVRAGRLAPRTRCTSKTASSSSPATRRPATTRSRSATPSTIRPRSTKAGPPYPGAWWSNRKDDDGKRQKQPRSSPRTSSLRAEPNRVGAHGMRPPHDPSSGERHEPQALRADRVGDAGARLLGGPCWARTRTSRNWSASATPTPAASPWPWRMPPSRA